MTEADKNQGAGEIHELIDAKPSVLAIYLSTHEARKITIKKKKIKETDGKKRKILIIKINPPCHTLDEGINQPLTRKNPGIRVTEDEFLETAMWLRTNRDNFATNEALNFGQIDKGLRAIQKKLGIKPIKPTASLSPKPTV